MKLAGRNIILGVTGGIAIYKSASLLRKLRVEEGADVQVIMTASALKFMTPLIFETFSGKPVWTNLFSDSEMVGVRHVDISKWADAVLICPATANIIGKAANGIADDLLSTVICDAGTKSVFAAAMESGMYNNPVVKENVKRLKDAGFGFIEPETGALASGAEGIGRLADEDTIIQALKNHLPSGTLEDKKIIVTAGPTREYIDPVRFISNPSTGKMGYALADAARKAGADVTLISGPVDLPEPVGVDVKRVTTVEEMKNALLEKFADCDALLMAAAVGDYAPSEVYEQKIKKNGEDLTLKLRRTEDILKTVKSLKKNKIVIGFSVETEKLTENSKSKLKEKGLDLIIANNPNENGAGFAHDTNKVSIIDSKGEIEELDLMSKQELSAVIIDKLSILLNGS
ncbi:MAG: bifunctional phosphopantothenoylcysteine decarboxylase/phosphopantothenate--cysteine ligase CoaBC [Candidatus Marinimicrobia bacterium]|nr:bifunctional phosphopantothenoylcysteine decarboxylase/phosphopantothenate--cysteine ligase CoaBC [Candidatus Neomarinimicrobiota bacterium]